MDKTKKREKYMKEQYYSLAIRKRENLEDRFFYNKNYSFDEIKIRCGKRYWFADPFVFEKDGIVYLFFEAYDLVECKGKIAYSILLDNNCASTPKVILDEDYHLSFPYIFERNGEIYIMPESCGSNTLQLYKAIKFPDCWELCSIQLSDVYLSDSIIFEDLKHNRFISCFEQYKKAPEGKLFYCWGKHHIYKLNNENAKEKITDLGTVAEGDFGIRNAGSSFFHNSKLYRVGQDCTGNQYGKGLVFFSVDSFNPYLEKIEFSIDGVGMSSYIHFAKRKKKILGVHTYNSSQNYEIIDFSFIDNLSLTNRFKRSLYIRMKRLRKTR